MGMNRIAARSAQPAPREEAIWQPLPVPTWLYWLTLALVFVAPSQIAYAVDRKHGPFIAYADIAAAAVVGLWLLWSLSRRQAREWVWAPKHIWALLVVAALSGLGAESLKDAILEIVQIGLYFVAAYMLFVNVLTTDERRRGALWTLLASTSLVVLYGLYHYVRASAAPATSDPGLLMGVNSVFQSRSAYGGFLCLALPVFFGLVMWTDRQWERYWALAVILLGAVTMVAPPLVFVLALILTLTALTWGGGARAAITAGVAAAFLLFTVAFLPLNRQAFKEMLNPFEEGPIFKVMQADSGAEQPVNEAPVLKKRWIEWMPALNMMAQNFMLGVGAGNYQANIGMPQYYGFLPNVKKSEPDTNNLYLVIGGSMGFAGMVCLLSYLGYFWRQAGKLWMHADSPWTRGLACGLHGAALSLLLTNLFSSLFVRGTGLIWALVFALIAAKALENRVRGSQNAAEL
ncbi:MAG: O-antigen ligase family protein [Armatimonadia bacterium]